MTFKQIKETRGEFRNSTVATITTTDLSQQQQQQTDSLTQQQLKLNDQRQSNNKFTKTQASPNIKHQQAQEKQQQQLKPDSPAFVGQTTISPPNSPTIGTNTSKLNLSFAGCGFLGIYHVGVASCFKEYAPQVSMHKICGSSAGALVAVAHICGKTQLGFATTDILKVAMDARARTLGPFHPAFDINAIVSEALDRGLPDDAHIKASGVLHISLTRVSDGANVIVSEFDTRDDLIQALLCSCFIPLFSGFVPPKYRGIAYVDGGFSNNLLVVDDKTITVSPFSGEADICPQDTEFTSLLQLNLSGTSIALSPNNLYRLSTALLPPEPEALKELCQQGFDDGMRYLQRNKLISCNRCLYIKSPPNINIDVSEIGELEIIDSQRERYRKLKRQQNQSSLRQRLARAVPGSRSRSLLSLSKDIDVDENDNTSTDDCDTDDSDIDYNYTDDDDDDCDDCLRRRQLALAETLPQLFMDKIREACDQVNKSLFNWIYSHRPIKYLLYIAAPYYLPVDLTLALFIKMWHAMPNFGQEFVERLNQLIDLLLDFVNKLEASSNQQKGSSTTSLLWKTAKELESEREAELLLKKQLPTKQQLPANYDENCEIKSIDAKATCQDQKSVHPFYLLIDNPSWKTKPVLKLSKFTTQPATNDNNNDDDKDHLDRQHSALTDDEHYQNQKNFDDDKKRIDDTTKNELTQNCCAAN